MIEFRTLDIDEGELLEIKSVVFTNSVQCPNVVYKKSLVESLEHIPLDSQRFIPLDYLKKHGENPREINGVLKFEHSFLEESSSEIINIISSKLEVLDLEQSFGDINHYLLTVCSELTRNGVIQNLKQAKSGDKRAINLKVIDSEESFVIQVVDQFGSLKQEKVFQRLKDVSLLGSYERKVYGAGLGLFMVSSSVDSLVFDVWPGKKTSITCHINKYKRLKHFKEKQTAIFFNRKEF